MLFGSTNDEAALRSRIAQLSKVDRSRWDAEVAKIPAPAVPRHSSTIEPHSTTSSRPSRKKCRYFPGGGPGVLPHYLGRGGSGCMVPSWRPCQCLTTSHGWFLDGPSGRWPSAPSSS
jgi:hypothetical protein